MAPARIETIALFYGHVAGNIGDVAINRGQITMLGEAFPGATIRVVLFDSAKSAHLAAGKASFGPEGAVEFVHMRTTPRRAPHYALNPGTFLKDTGTEAADLIVLAAGEHLFQYETEPNRRNLFWRTLPAFAARACGKPCLMMPSTFGPFEAADGRALAAALFATGLRAAARDARSAALLGDMLPQGAPMTALDPAFFLTPPETPLASGSCDRTIGLVMRSEMWGLRLARWAPAPSPDLQNNVDRASVAVRFGTAFADGILTDPATRLRLLVQTPADRPVAEAIAAAVPAAREAGRLTISEPSDITAYLEGLAGVDCIVASRFHALILGLVAGRPGFGVYFDVHGQKILGLFDLLGHPECCADLSETAAEDVAAAVVERIMTDPPRMAAFADPLAALKHQTLDWIRSDWTAPIPETRPESIQALGALALALTEDVLDKALARGRRLEKENAMLTERIAATEADAAARRDEAEALAAQLAEARAEADRLQAEVATLTADAATLRKERIRQVQTQRRIEYDAKNTRESVSFRLGHALVLAAKSPRRLLSLPREAAALFREGRAKQPAHRRGVAVEAPSNRLTGEARTRLMATFGEGGAEAVRAEIVAAQAGSPEDAAQALVAAAVTLADEGHREAGPLLVGEAVRLDRNETTLRALFWTTQKQGDYRAAGRAFADIEQIVGPEPTPQQKKWLEKLRKSPVHVVSAAAHIPPRAAPGPYEAGRICYVLHNAQPYSSGGYATRAHGLARGLAKAGWEVVALTRPGFPLDTKPELLPEDVPVETVLDGIVYRTIHGPKRHDLSRRDYMVAAADAIEAALAEIRPEIVIAASAHLSALPALIAARRLGLPFVYEVRGFWEVTRQSRKPALEGTLGHRVDVALEAITAEEADHVFTLTEPMREELFARGVETPITLLPNSCDPDRFSPRPRDAGLAAKLGIPEGVPVIGYIGTFVQYEGLEHLAAACARLAAEGRDFRLLLVGNEDTSGSGRGPITTEILATAVESGLARRLIMPGRVPHEEVEAYYSLIDIAPFPRKPQPVTEMVSPMKPLEALAMEKAVVVSSVRALTEMIRHEETGLVFEKGSVDSLTATLARLIDDPDLRARLGRTARDWVVRGRTWDATAERAASELARLRLAPPAVPTPLTTDA
jgi:glycosyltransferase involved in cell wall biosynthesis/polysaccharide pyruvyl transferase WcaK-like protein/uncharacterized coiled-coil protein SlyX